MYSLFLNFLEGNQACIDYYIHIFHITWLIILLIWFLAVVGIAAAAAADDSCDVVGIAKTI